MKKIKKTVSIILALMMVFGVFAGLSIGASAAEVKTVETGADTPHTLTSADVVLKEKKQGYYIYAYNGNYSSIIIPAEIDGKQIYGIDELAFRNKKSLKSVTISSGISYIECLSFADCPNLSEVNFSNYGVFIQSGAFANCPDLKSVEIPEEVFVVGNYAFGFVNVETNTFYSNVMQHYQTTVTSGTRVSKIKVIGKYDSLAEEYQRTAVSDLFQ